MYDILALFLHLIVTIVRLMKPGGLRAVVAESVLTRHQILILNRSRTRAPNLRVCDRIIAGLCTLLMRPSRVLRCGMVLKPSTLLHFHHLLTKRKYRMLFSSQRGCRPGPKGPAQELIDAVVGIKRRNPAWGCPRIAQQITLAFGVEIDKDVVLPDSWKTLPAKIRIRRSVLYLSRSGDGQCEHRPVSLRIAEPTNP